MVTTNNNSFDTGLAIANVVKFLLVLRQRLCHFCSCSQTCKKDIGIF